MTFSNLADPDGTLIQALIDINPAKQGKFLAGTGHPIMSPDELVAGPPATVLVLNPNYQREIAEELGRRRFAGDILDLMAEGRVAA